MHFCSLAKIKEVMTEKMKITSLQKFIKYGINLIPMYLNLGGAELAMVTCTLSCTVASSAGVPPSAALMVRSYSACSCLSNDLITLTKPVRLSMLNELPTFPENNL